MRFTKESPGLLVRKAPHLNLYYKIHVVHPAILHSIGRGELRHLVVVHVVVNVPVHHALRSKATCELLATIALGYPRLPSIRHLIKTSYQMLPCSQGHNNRERQGLKPGAAIALQRENEESPRHVRVLLGALASGAWSLLLAARLNDFVMQGTVGFYKHVWTGRYTVASGLTQLQCFPDLRSAPGNRLLICTSSSKRSYARYAALASRLYSVNHERRKSESM